jgi:hypothetical protein
METETNHVRGSERSAGDAGDACAMVIFGASGDLTKRKLIPALFNLAKDNLLSRDFALIGFARPEMSHEQFRDKCTEEVKQFATGQVDPDLWHWFVRRLYYVSGDFADPAAFENLKTVLAEADREHGTRGNYFYYLATAPTFFSTCIHQAADAGLMTEEDGKWRRVIVEKPFGRDFDSAHALNLDLQKVIHERQIYRVDHYLGRKRSRTFWLSVSPTGSSSRSGTGIISTMFRSPRRKQSGWSSAEGIMKRRAHCGTCCRIICSNWCASPPWNRRFPSMPTWFAINKPRSSRQSSRIMTATC